MNHKDDMKDIQYYSPLKTTDLTKILSFTGKKNIEQNKRKRKYNCNKGNYIILKKSL